MVATRFYPGAQESATSRDSLADLSVSTKGVIATANRSAFALSQSLATPFAVLSLVSMAVTVVTMWFIQKTNFLVKVLSVLFFED